MRSEADSPYWVANIITTCGQLLLLRYEGYQDDRRADFWCDIMTADLHPLGWSRQHGKTMRAPEGEEWLVLECFFLFLWGYFSFVVCLHFFVLMSSYLFVWGFSRSVFLCLLFFGFLGVFLF